MSFFTVAIRQRCRGFVAPPTHDDSSPGSLARGSLEKCPSDCNTTRYDARLSYAPLSETVLATLTSDQRARLQGAYRDALDVRHRVDEKLMTTHLLHFRETAIALGDLRAAVDACGVTELAVFGVLRSHLNETDRMLSAIVGYRDEYAALAPARHALRTLLARQRDGVHAVLQSHWHVADDDASRKLGMASEIISATRSVINAMRSVRFVEREFTTDIGTFRNARRPVIVVSNDSCWNASQLWMELSEDLLTRAENLSASVYGDAYGEESWSKRVREIRDFWTRPTQEDHERVSECVVEFSELLHEASPIKERLHVWLKDLTSGVLQDYRETFDRVVRSPLVDAALGERFEDGSVKIVQLLWIMQDETEYVSILDLLQRLQTEMKYDVLDRLRDFVSRIQIQIGAEFNATSRLIVNLSAYIENATVFEKYHARLAVFDKVMHGLWLRIGELSQVVPTTTNLLEETLQRYRTFLQTTVARVNMNQAFVR